MSAKEEVCIYCGAKLPHKTIFSKDGSYVTCSTNDSLGIKKMSKVIVKEYLKCKCPYCLRDFQMQRSEKK